MGGCSAINCSNHSRKGHRLFKFPAEIERRKKWIVNCRRDGWIPGPHAQLCSDHFEESQFEQNRQDGWKRLKQTAIPTLFNIPNPPKSLSMKRVKGVGCPKPDTLLASHLNDSQQEEENPLTKRIQELESENAMLREKLAKNDQSMHFLSEEQKKISIIERSSISSWSQEGIVQALKLRFALGKFGYEYIGSTGYPTPSYSTLNRRMQAIQMNFGVLDSFIKYLKHKIEFMSINDKWCSIMIDEMEISKIKDFDASTKSFIGGVTLGHKTVPGNHYTVVLLRGMKSKWKQVIAHEITGPSTHGSAMKELFDKTLEACRELGLIVKAVVSDMGSNNRAMWREFGVGVSRNLRNTVYSTENENINCIADVPHLLKNLRSATLSRQLLLPTDICQKEGLPSRAVTSGYIKMLWIKEIESETSLRSLHHLNKDHLFPSHFSKMNVATAVQLFSIKTAAALEKAVRLQLVESEALTTAWWVRLVQEWFELMTARHVKKGITVKNKEKKIMFLQNFINVIQNMQFGIGWKPLQTGMILSTVSIINLANEALSAGFSYFLPGRLSQDALENVFSQIRRRAGSKPTALKARRALKLVCVAQFISDLKDVNYFSDNDHQLFVMPKLKDLHKDSEAFILADSKKNKPLTCNDENDVYCIAGATLNGILSEKLCDACVFAAKNAIDTNEENIPEYVQLLTKYADMGGLCYPSSGFYRICRETEREVQHCKDTWVEEQSPINHWVITSIIGRCDIVDMPLCCNLKEKIANYYLRIRCKGIVRHMHDKSTYEVSYSSSSLGKKL